METTTHNRPNSHTQNRAGRSARTPSEPGTAATPNGSPAPSNAPRPRRTSEFVIDEGTGLKRLRYGGELPKSERHASDRPWEDFRDRRAELDSWVLQVPDPQTHDTFGMPVRREFVGLLALFGGWSIGRVVQSIRSSEGQEQISGDEAYALVDRVLTVYAEDFAFQSPECQAASRAFDDHARRHGWFDHHEVQEATRDPEAVAYNALPEVQQLVSDLSQSWNDFQARIAEECGESQMARLMRDMPEAHDLLVKAGTDRLARSSVRTHPYV